MGSVFSDESLKCFCQPCVLNEDDLRSKAKQSFNMDSMEKQLKSDDEQSQDDTFEPDPIDIDTNGMIYISDMGLDEKTIKLIADSPLIRLGTIEPSATHDSQHSVIVDVHQKNSIITEANNNVPRINPFEIQQSITYKYHHDETDADEDDEESESELDETERSEIKKMKTIDNEKRRNSMEASLGLKLYRNDTNTVWQKEDVETLHSDMKQQLALLQNKVGEESDDEIAMRNSKLNLLRNRSANKWDNKNLGKMQNEMQKEMMHLLIKSRDSTSV